jgi:uncharacterized protein YcnI
MSMSRHAARAGVTLSAAGLLVLAGAGIASAHVSAHSPDQLVGGGDAEIVFRSPNESTHAAPMTKLQVDFPLNTPVSNADVEPVPGWSAKVTMTHLAKPVTMAKDTVTDAVGSIVWTADPGSAGVADGQFQEFPISTEGLPTNTTELVFTATQTYADGEVVNWNQPTPPGGAEPDNPAPSLTLAADTGATGSGAPGSTAAPAASGSDDTARWLGGIGIVLAAIGIGFGAGAFARGRRPGGPAPAGAAASSGANPDPGVGPDAGSGPDAGATSEADAGGREQASA